MSAPLQKAPPAPVRTSTRTLGVVLDRLNACEESADQRPVEGVAALGAIQREASDAAPVGLEQEDLGHS